MVNALVAAPAARPVQHPWITSTLIGRALHWIAATGTCLLWSLALLLMARRIGGGLIEPLGAATAVALSLGLGAAALLIRAAVIVVWLARPQSMTRGKLATFLLAPGVACYFLAVAITLPGTTTATALGLYLSLLLFEIGSLAMVAWGVTHGVRFARPTWLRAVSHDRERPPSAVSADEESLPAGVTQQLVRRRTAEGCDAIHGTMRVRFAAYQRTEVLHVAFCPPFNVNPRWTAKALSGPALTIKQAQVFPYGARIEVRLNESPLAPVESLVSFTAIEPA